jgi:hypothetical protein
MGITAHGSTLYAMQTKIGQHSFRGLLVDYSTAPISSNMSEQNSQTNGYTIIRVPMLPGPPTRHYMCVQGSEKCTQPSILSSTETHKFEVTLKLWDNTKEIGRIPAGETRV